MRDIKFRAWDRKENRWIYFTLPDNLFNLDLEYHQKRDFEHWTEFTGLKDKNGKEVYEGDIVIGKEHTGAVEWQTDGWIIHQNGKGYQGLCDWGIEKLEILGNIYENPELLKEAHSE